MGLASAPWFSSAPRWPCGPFYEFLSGASCGLHGAVMYLIVMSYRTIGDDMGTRAPNSMIWLRIRWPAVAMTATRSLVTR